MEQKLNKKTRSYCFTDFIMDKAFWERYYDEYKVKYLIIGVEVCPSTGREHYQGFLYFNNPRAPSSIRKSMKPRHVEACKGNSSQNIKYCSKDKNILLELGERPAQGNRSDLEELKNRINNGEKVNDLLQENPNWYHQYGRTMLKIEDEYNLKRIRTSMTSGTWYYGSTGVGKSQRLTKIFDENPDDCYVWPFDGDWNDDYNGQKNVLIDDYRGDIPYAKLLKMVDGHNFCSLRRRCRSAIRFTSEHVYITSSLSPEQVYCNLSKKDSLNQLYRRFRVIEIKSDGTEEVKGNTETLTSKLDKLDLKTTYKHYNEF